MLQAPILNSFIPQAPASHLLEYVILLHPQTGTYSLVQAISFLLFSVTHPLSFEIQPTVNSNVKISSGKRFNKEKPKSKNTVVLKNIIKCR